MLGNEGLDHRTMPFLEDKAVKGGDRLLFLFVALLIQTNRLLRSVNIGKIREVKLG